MDFTLIVPIIMALLSFFATKKATGSTSKAALAAGLAGTATWYATKPDVPADGNSSGDLIVGPPAPATDATGKPILDANGKPVFINGGGSYGTIDRMIDTTGRVLSSWGATGTATVVGTTAIATSSKKKKYLPWALGGLALVFIMKKE